MIRTTIGLVSVTLMLAGCAGVTPSASPSASSRPAPRPGPALGAMPPECSEPAPPAHPLAVAVQGQPVELTGVTLRDAGTIGDGEVVHFDTVRLEIVGRGSFELGMTLAIPHGERIDGRTYRRLGEDADDQPSFPDGTSAVQGWRVDAPAFDVDGSFVFHSATLRVDFGKAKKGVAPGKIQFCSPGLGVYASGAFEAAVGE